MCYFFDILTFDLNNFQHFKGQIRQTPAYKEETGRAEEPSEARGQARARAQLQGGQGRGWGVHGDRPHPGGVEPPTGGQGREGGGEKTD